MKVATVQPKMMFGFDGDPCPLLAHSGQSEKTHSMSLSGGKETFISQSRAGTI
jgi:hypothetical protein